MSKEAMKLALEALEDFEDAIRYDNEQDDIGARVCCGVLSYNPHAKDCKAVKAITALREALAEQPAPVQQDPVAFLANGTRFKISYDARQSGGQIHGIPPELGGRWVALVAAEDDCHLKLISPPAQRKPLGYAGITIWGGDATATKVFTKTQMKFAREPRSLIEAVVGQCLDELAAHGIKENT